MSSTGKLKVVPLSFVSIFLAFTLAMGCRSGSANLTQPSGVVGALRLDDSLLCLKANIQHPSGPFHFSYKKKSMGQAEADWEVDVTPGEIDGFAKTGTVIDRIHGQRTDQNGWNNAVLTLIEPLPDKIFEMARSATKEEGEESVHGYQTVKYLIDATRLSPLKEKSKYIFVTGAKDYHVTGDAWVSRDTGCLVKFAIDFEENFDDGRIEKTRYEGGTTKR